MIDINHWGSRPQERALAYPCDKWLSDPHHSLFRAVTIQATPQHLYRWLCQLKLAPYSYDWVDNLGRQSPRQLVPGCENPVLGQTMMTLFQLVEFQANQHLTMACNNWLTGHIVISYVILDHGDHCRLVAKLNIRYPRGPLGWLGRLLLPACDLVMMRKQLLNLKGLAEERHGRFLSQRCPGHWLHYVEAGTPGKPILLLVHGGTGNWSNYRSQVAEFARDYHVFAPDHRGHGASPWPGPGHIDDFYYDLEEFADSLGAPFELVGHSFGGYLAVRLAASRPEWVRHLALFNTGPHIPRNPKFKVLESATVAADWLARPEGVIAARREVCDHLIQELIDQWDCTPFYPQIQCPALVVLGGLDPLMPVAVGKLAAQAIPNCKLKLLPLAGHVIMWDHPKVVNRLLRELFQTP